jgi:diguanylate cyclase (GGDEF)-like protein
VLALAVLLLGGVTCANVFLHGQSRHQEVTRSTLGELGLLLQEESSLQWKTLADRNAPVRVAREVGAIRAREHTMVGSLSGADAAKVIDLNAQIAGYHDVLDRELGLLGVGKTDEALALELGETDPRFANLNTALRKLEDQSEAAAARANSIADVSLILAMAAALVAIGLLLFRFEREHRATDDANREMLAQQRLALDTLAENEILIKYQASHDPLTGLPNRRLLMERMETGTGGQQALLLVDLDAFKPVNDRLGHAAGDELLISVGGRLLATVRACDTVARIGGDEFAVVIDGGGAPAAIHVAERIVASVGQPFAVAGTEVHIGASVGIAVNYDGCDSTELLRRADTAMYDVKKDCKGAFTVYKPPRQPSAETPAPAELVGPPPH